MRKSDKLKNFKKINLIVENRYLESKGIVKESFNDIDDNNQFSNLGGISDFGESEKTMAFRNVINAFKKIKSGAQPNEVNVGDALRRFKEYASEDEFQRVSNEYNNIVTTHGSHIGMDKSETNGLEEGFLNRFFDITGKDEESKKQKAIQEINNFDFRRLFLQTNNNLDIRGKNELASRVAEAGKYMPTVKELRGDLFNTNSINGEHVYMMNEKGERIEGFIPNSFFIIKGQHDLIDNETAKGKLQGYLN